MAYPSSSAVIDCHGEAGVDNRYDKDAQISRGHHGLGMWETPSIKSTAPSTCYKLLLDAVVQHQEQNEPFC